MSQGMDIFTNRGIEKIRNAADTASSVAITHIALGDANGAAYNPVPTQTALNNERLRAAIESKYQIGADAYAVKASFPPETAEIIVREMGFFDQDGDLIAIWAGVNVGDTRRTGTIAYLIQHVIQFQGVTSGLVVINAPDDDLMTHLTLDIQMSAIFAEEQFAQRLAIRDLQNAN